MYWVTNQIPFKRAKVIHILHIIEELQAHPTIIFSLDINHTNDITIVVCVRIPHKEPILPGTVCSYLHLGEKVHL
jgi:hypothetical protein